MLFTNEVLGALASLAKRELIKRGEDPAFITYWCAYNGEREKHMCLICNRYMVSQTKHALKHLKENKLLAFL